MQDTYNSNPYKIFKICVCIIYVQAMIREAYACGYENYLVSSVRSDCCVDTDCIEQDESMFVNFPNADVSYHIPGMSDVMPYESTRFCDLSEDDLCEYEKAFSGILQNAVNKLNQILFTATICGLSALWLDGNSRTFRW